MTTIRDTPGYAPVTRDPAELWVALSSANEPLWLNMTEREAGQPSVSSVHVSRYVHATTHEAAIADAEQRGARAERERLDPKLAALAEAAKRVTQAHQLSGEPASDAFIAVQKADALQALAGAVYAIEAP